MLPASEVPPLLARLRSDTRAAHQALEQHAFNHALTTDTLTTAVTAQFLAKMYGFLQPYETALHAQAGAFGPAWQLPQRQRAHLILEDLQCPAADLPLCPAMPPLATPVQLLGAMYVVEGSTLGGQLITRHLTRAGIPLRRYFTGYGERTGLMWKSFCQLLTEASPAVAHPEELVAAASRTFQHLDAWLNQL